MRKLKVWRIIPKPFYPQAFFIKKAPEAASMCDESLSACDQVAFPFLSLPFSFLHFPCFSSYMP
jgi:hypothetical protein